VEFVRHGVIPFTRFSALLVKKIVLLGRKRAKQLTFFSTPEKKNS
jgi:hypothetical protein